VTTLSYRQSGLVLQQGSVASVQQIRDLQHDLRRLGYLKRGIDGVFGGQTKLAVQGLQHDLMHNGGSGGDGSAPVKLVDFNRNRVTSLIGAVDQDLVACISDLLDDGQVPRLPSAQDPRQENKKIVAQIAALSSTTIPIPFLMAILKQESNLQHFNEPGAGDEDTYITIGLDRNVASAPHVITSRGYGAGQYTLFHHPPHQTEVQDFMLDVGRNVQKAVVELTDKFEHFVNGPSSGTRADERIAQFGSGPLRRCKFQASDPRFLRDCKQCLLDAGASDITADVTPVYSGSALVFSSTPLYDMTRDAVVYQSVPIRKNIGCDWPYAARRYNGSGLGSYHYQTRILHHLLAL
jgi:peptidoglycan hydrolase-like protein with peptidoglycan-binding domain